MKKTTVLALATVLSLGLVACTKNHNDHYYGNGYRAEILFSEYNGENLLLTVRKNDCENKDGPVETMQLSHQYDSTLVVGACVRVLDNNEGLKNISTFSPRSPI
ncbi:hypothetical protein ACFSAV_04610 [Pasteurella oralis]|uniref:Lipoprotein n=1 Tax=Pasteurella oralis TaxID=1071947 RepID=A0ABW4NT27_9PAST|nr:hypothetical protein [Pasteurella oralis]MDO5054853.1 hypothetical protein [Pasteurella oralis]